MNADDMKGKIAVTSLVLSVATAIVVGATAPAESLWKGLLAMTPGILIGITLAFAFIGPAIEETSS